MIIRDGDAQTGLVLNIPDNNGNIAFRFILRPSGSDVKMELYNANWSKQWEI